MEKNILVIGEKQRLTQTMDRHFSDRYKAFEYGADATQEYLKNGRNYKLVVMSGGFAWEKGEKNCPKQSINLAGFMEMWYKSENVLAPEIIIYEQDKEIRDEMEAAITDSTTKLQITLVENVDQLLVELEWWLSKEYFV